MNKRAYEIGFRDACADILKLSRVGYMSSRMQQLAAPMPPREKKLPKAPEKKPSEVPHEKPTKEELSKS